MTMLTTRLRELGEKEGFDIEVFDGENPVDPKANGFAAYPFDRRAKSDMTVSEWKAARFSKTYPGYSCKVLYGDGREATGNAKLETVRRSYEE